MGVLNVTDYAKARIDWPTGGAPGWKISDDVTFIRAVETDDEYNRLRDLKVTTIDADTLQEEITYTRVWEVSFVCYGPNSFDNARNLKSSLLRSTPTLAAANLYPVSDIPAPQRVPELFSGQWWERTDISFRLNEQVTETEVINSIASAEVLISTAAGEVADLNISEE